MTESYIREYGPKVIANGFCICAPKAGAKGPLYHNWQNEPITIEEAEHWGSADAPTLRARNGTTFDGVGILCGRGDFPVYGIDVDILDSELADAVHSALCEKHGDLCSAIIRVGRAPKFLLVIRGEPGMKYSSTPKYIDKNGNRCQVEVIAGSKQFVAYGIHPNTGKPYSYPYADLGGEIVNTDVSKLPFLSIEDVADAIKAATEVFESHGLKQVSGASAPAMMQSVSEFDVGLPPLGLSREEATELVRAAYGVLDDYNDWREAGMALNHEFPGKEGEPRFELGYDIWRTLSAESTKADTDDKLRSKYLSFKKSEQCGAVTMRTVRKKAMTKEDGLFARTLDPTAEGLASHLIYTYFSRLRYVADTDEWLFFNGAHWVGEDEGKPASDTAGEKRRTNIISFARAAFEAHAEKHKAKDIERLQADRDAGKLSEAEFRREVTNSPWAKLLSRLRNKPGFVKSVIEDYVKSSVYIRSRAQDFDHDQDILGLADGYVSLSTGARITPVPDLYVRKHINIDAKGDEDCPKFKAFLKDIMSGDEACAQYLVDVFGYALLGNPTEDMILFLVGKGSNGKSVLLRVVSEVFGSYCQTVNQSTLVSTPGTRASAAGSARPDIMALAGARIAVCNELDADTVLKEADVKAMTGRDGISARGLWQGQQTIKPTWTVVVATNYMPSTKDRSEGMFRRIRIVEFKQRYATDEVDAKENGGKLQNKNLTSELLEEKAGILNLFIAGARRYAARKHIPLPIEVRRSAAMYRKDSDFLREWFDVCCETVEGCGRKVPNEDRTLKAFFSSWEIYAKGQGCFFLCPTIRQFSRMLRNEMGVDIKKSNGLSFSTTHCLKEVGRDVTDFDDLDDMSVGA